MNSGFCLDPDGVYRCEALKGFEFAKHGFGSRLGNPPVDITLRQIHSDLIRNAEGLRDRELDGDALISQTAGLTIGVRTADCVPILLLDPQTHTVAAVHAGWRGTAAGIASKVVSRLASNFQCSPGALFAAIGPCIRECCYEVGPEVAREFVSYFPAWAGQASRRKLNLAEANFRQLTLAGIPGSQIFDAQLCTSCNPECLYSYRREPDNPGRMLASVSRLF